MQPLAALALLWAAFALGQPADEEEPTAAPASIALEMIDQAGASDIFLLLPSRWADRVRHGPSGMTCRLDWNAGARVVMERPGNAGSTASCVQPEDGGSLTLTARKIGGLDPEPGVQRAATEEARTNGAADISIWTKTAAGREAWLAAWVAPSRGRQAGHLRATFKANDWLIVVAWDTDAGDADAFHEAAERMVTGILEDMEN